MIPCLIPERPNMGSIVHHHSLLLVEDDPCVARLVCMSLDLIGYGVRHASTGHDGVVLARAHAFDGAILDYHLPDTNGREVALELRQLLGPDFPLVIVTGSDLLPLQSLVDRQEVDGCLSKPFDMGNVLRVLKLS
jgi:DNA-binding response OmpR family regulator